MNGQRICVGYDDEVRGKQASACVLQTSCRKSSLVDDQRIVKRING